MKKTVKIICLFLYVILLIGCKEKESGTDTSSDIDSSGEIFKLDYLNGGSCYSEAYALYTGKSGSEEEILLPHYYDIAADADMVLCSKPNCDHESDGCFAKKIQDLSRNYGRYIRGDKLYFLGIDDSKDENSIFNCVLYSADVNESTLSSEVKIENLVMPQLACVLDDKVFIIYRNEEDIITEKDENGNVHKHFGEQLSPYETGFYIYSSNDGSVNKVVVSTDRYNSEITMTNCYNGKLYFLDTYFDEDVFRLYDLDDYQSRVKHAHWSFYCYDIAEGSLKELFADDDRDFISICGDSAFYYNKNSQGERESELFRLNLESGDAVKVYDGNVSFVSYDGKNYILSSYEDEKYWFTRVSGETNEMTGKTKYNKEGAAFINASIGDYIFFTEMSFSPDGETSSTLGYAKSSEYFSETGCDIKIIGKV